MEEQPLILTIKIYDEKTKEKITKLRKETANITEIFINMINLICM